MVQVCKSFQELTPKELYAVLRLRNEVFVVEQQCIFQDADDKDQYCHHLMLWENDALVAYARLVPAGISYPETSIGRIVTAPAFRKKGVGKLLVAAAIEKSNELFGKQPIKIGAQLYLQHFYESFGFKQCGFIYLEDGIEHIEMLYMQLP